MHLLMTISRIKSQESVTDESSGQGYWAAARGTVTRAWEGSSKRILKSPRIRLKLILGKSDGDPGTNFLALQPFQSGKYSSEGKDLPRMS